MAVATVLAMRPQILVLDEPSSNLDPASRRELADILQALDITMLMVTHDLYALELCPRSLVMNGGRVVADGATAEVLADEALMAASRARSPFGFFPALAEAERARARRGSLGRLRGAGRAPTRDRRSGSDRPRSHGVAGSDPAGHGPLRVSRSSLPHRPHVRCTCSASSVLWYSAPVSRVGVGQHPDLLEQGGMR